MQLTPAHRCQSLHLCPGSWPRRLFRWEEWRYIYPWGEKHPNKSYHKHNQRTYGQRSPLGKMLSPKMAPKAANRSSLLILNTYRMWVAGKDSNCRDRKSSLCLSWCFCSSESVGCLDSSSNSPGTQTKNLSTFLNGSMGQRGSDLCSSGLRIYSTWKPGWSKLALWWALRWCGYVCGFILFLQLSTHLHYCQPEYLGCLRCPASWRDTPPLPPHSHWLSVRRKLALGGL